MKHTHNNNNNRYTCIFIRQRSSSILLFVSCIICYIQKCSVPVYYNDKYGEKSTTTTAVHSTATTQLVEIPKPGSTQPTTTDSNYSNPVITVTIAVTITVLVMIVIFVGIGGIVKYRKLRRKHNHLKQKYQSQSLETENKNHDGASNDKNEYQTLKRQNSHGGENDPSRRSHRTRTTTKTKYVQKRYFPFCCQHNNKKDYHNSIESLECNTLLKQSPSNATETTDIQRGPAEATHVPHGSAKADRQHEPAVTTTQGESNRNSQACGADEPDGGAGHAGNQPSGENVVREFPLHQTLSGRVLAKPNNESDSDQYPSRIVISSHRHASTQSQPPDDEPRPVPVRNQTNNQPSVRTQGTLNQPPSRSANASSNSGSVVIHSPPTTATNTVPETSHSQTLTNRNLKSQPPASSAAASSSAGFRPIQSSDAGQNQPSVNSHSQVQPSRQPLVSPNAPQQAPSGLRVANNQEAASNRAEARLPAIPSAAQPARSVAAHGHPSMGQNQLLYGGDNMASGGYNSRLQRQQPGVPQPGHAVAADSGQGTFFADSALFDSLGPTPSDYAEQIERAYAEAEEELEAHPSQRGCYDNVSIDLGGDSSDASECPVVSVPDTYAMDLDERVTSPASTVVREQQQQRQQQASVSQLTQPRDQHPPVDHSGNTELKTIDNSHHHVPSETPQPRLTHPVQASGETVPVKATPGTVIRPVPPGRGKLIKQALQIMYSTYSASLKGVNLG